MPNRKSAKVHVPEYQKEQLMLNNRKAICYVRAQQLINLEIQVLVQSPKSRNNEFSQYLDGRLPLKCCLSVDANP